MAENEELDLNLPGARRWFDVSRCVRVGGTAQQIAAIGTPVHQKAIRTAILDLLKRGVSPEAVYAAKNDLAAMRILRVRAGGHAYFRLMQDVVYAFPGCTRREFNYRWMSAGLEKVADQIAVRESSSAGGTNFFDVRRRMQAAAEIMAPGIDEMAKKRDENPDWKPVRRSSTEHQLPPVLSRSLLS